MVSSLIGTIDPATKSEAGDQVYSNGDSGGDPVKYGTKPFNTPKLVYDRISEPGSSKEIHNKR